MTEEQVELEQAAMTGEEKAEVFSDLFGEQCAVNTYNVKRVRRDLSEDSINFLMEQMRFELKQIPKDEKRALLKAEKKCIADEFSDAWLE